MTLHEFLVPLAGGMLIGAAALLLYAALGRIAGISGIAFGAVLTHGTERTWRVLFIAGLVGGGWLAALLFGALPSPAAPSEAAITLALVAGTLTGFGTRLGNGCTSGHGVCGLARLSPRSLFSVSTFMGVGMLVATLIRPALA